MPLSVGSANRRLAALGVFAEVEERAFAQTPTSMMVQRDSDSGWHEFTVVYGSVYRAFAEASPAVRSGENMFERGSRVGLVGLARGPT